MAEAAKLAAIGGEAVADTGTKLKVAEAVAKGAGAAAKEVKAHKKRSADAGEDKAQPKEEGKKAKEPKAKEDKATDGNSDLFGVKVEAKAGPKKAQVETKE